MELSSLSLSSINSCLLKINPDLVLNPHLSQTKVSCQVELEEEIEEAATDESVVVAGNVVERGESEFA